MNDYEVIKHIIAQTPAPARGLRYDIVEFETYYAIRLYRNNYDVMIESLRVKFATWISDVIANCRHAGVNIFLEVWDH